MKGYPMFVLICVAEHTSAKGTFCAVQKGPIPCKLIYFSDLLLLRTYYTDVINPSLRGSKNFVFKMVQVGATKSEYLGTSGNQKDTEQSKGLESVKSAKLPLQFGSLRGVLLSSFFCGFDRKSTTLKLVDCYTVPSSFARK